MLMILICLGQEVNNFDRDLKSFCESYGMQILNGRVPGDKNGDITCVANGGRSVIDYMLVNTRLYSFIQHFKVIVQVESDYFLVICKVTVLLMKASELTQPPLRTNTVIPASSLTKSATYKSFCKI